MGRLKLKGLDSYHTVEVMVDGKWKEFKIPIELSVGETEEILELHEEVEKAQEELIREDGSAQLRYVFEKMLAICFVLFKRYQPDTTIEFLQDNLTQNDIMTIAGYFQSNRYLQQKEQKGGDEKKQQAD